VDRLTGFRRGFHPLWWSWLLSALWHPIALGGTPWYQPPSLPLNQTVTERLTERDSPTGEGGYSRDYRLNLQAGDQIVLELHSEDFDPLIVLIAPDGSTLGANDDGPEGGTSALLFARIPETGIYTVRARTFGSRGVGAFRLTATRLRPE